MSEIKFTVCNRCVNSKPEEIEADELITLREAAALLEPPYTHVTVWRWANRGLRAPCGCTVKLPTLRVGGHRLTSAAWLRAFLHHAAIPSKVRDVTPADADEGGAQ